MVWRLIVTAVAGYLIGSVSFGYLAGKIFKGKDIRDVGSGNAGTANAIRNYGWGVGAFTFVGDLVKGSIAALVGVALFGELGVYFNDVWVQSIFPGLNVIAGLDSHVAIYVGGVAAVIGHIFPVFLRFKGGKGVATSLGVFLIIMPLPALAVFLIAVIIIWLTKTMSIGSMIGMGLILVASLVFNWGNFWHHGTCALLLAVVLFYHRHNMVRLAEGKENQL
ncbi:MAG: glycerol-3-phosphate 1-O-acyltransferase PlsY, partial [Clostridia bacterium]|jgi:acyl phosphate:glycerol-3-phosphate acyltransferase|nr:glycerol-3-phosphate 1-O-acyltransferase PlsY [Clostridia bacterium]MBT7121568.1 glycerol-3-phosphate 1-O-acyltransferase PlsY [Clostridia bacterium]